MPEKHRRKQNSILKKNQQKYTYCGSKPLQQAKQERCAYTYNYLRFNCVFACKKKMIISAKTCVLKYILYNQSAKKLII